MKKNEEKKYQPKLILHFDLHKTIIFFDTKKAKNKLKELNRICLQSSWGEIIKNEKNEEIWKLVHFKLTTKKPEIYFEKKLVNYENFLKLKKNLKNENFLKNEKKNIEKNFFSKNGLGSKLKNEYEKLLRLITLPKFITEKYQKKKLSKKNSKTENFEKSEKNIFEILENLSENFKDNKICIVPSFYKLLIFLRKNKIEFSIIFRTFGNDLKFISKEFNYFINGQHPLYSGKNGTSLIKFDVGKIPRNFNLLKKNFGIFFRKNSDYNKTFLFKGNIENECYDEILKNEEILKFETFNEIFLEKKESLKKNACLAYKDDFGFLKKNFDIKKNNFCGKLFLLDKSDFSTLEIFFDDNISEKNENENLIDIWDIYKKKRISLKEAKNKFLFKVDIISAILDQDYFIKAVNNSILLREKDFFLEKENKNIFFENEKKKKNDFKIFLQNCKGSEYLKNTVYPILEPAFKILAKEKPNNPIEFLSIYLLQNKNKIKNN